MIPVWSDLIALIGAFLVFPLVIVVPGFVVGFSTNVLNFRTEAGAFSKSILLSLVTVPWTVYMCFRFVGIEAVWVLLGSCWLLAIIFVIPRLHTFIRSTLRKVKGRHVAYVLLGLTCSAFLIIDFQDGGHLIRPLMSHDYVKHVAVTDAISRTGLPPVNPSYFPGEPLSLFYYYFWFLFCSLVDLLGGSLIDARSAVLASVLWSGIAVLAALQIYVKTLARLGVKGIRSGHVQLALLLLLVTGLDIIPITFSGIVQHVFMQKPVLAEILWWNDIIAWWGSSVLWVPHHVGAVLSCLVAFILIIDQDQDQYKPSKASLLLIPIALSSSVGMSIWVSITAAWCLIIWFLFVLKKKWKGELIFLFITGFLAIGFTLPFILDIQQASQLQSFPVALHVKPFYNLDLMLADINPVILHSINFLFLPANYALELGFLTLGVWIYWKYRSNLKIPLNRAELFLLVLFCACLFFCTFFRSAIINNDLGWRGFMFVQFLLILYSTPLLDALSGNTTALPFELSQTVKLSAKILLVLSCLTLLAEIYIGRFHPLGPVHDQTVAVRQAHEWLDQNLKPDTIVQHNPDTNIEYFHALYGNRQVAIADALYGQLYGIRKELFDSTYAEVLTLFRQETEIEQTKHLVAQYGIDALLVKRRDAVWADSNKWDNHFTRIYRSACCRIYALSDSVLSMNNTTSLNSLRPANDY